MAEKKTGTIPPQQPTPQPMQPAQQPTCAVCFATFTSSEETYQEPCYPQVVFHLDHLFDKKATLKCRLHRSESLMLHCECCNQLMCFKCSIHGDHRLHLCKHAVTKFEELKKVITPLQKQSEGVLSSASEALAQLNKSQEMLMQQKSLAQREIEQTFCLVQELAEKRKDELLVDLEAVSLKHEKSITSDKELLNNIRVSISSCLDSVKRNIPQGSVAGVSELVDIASTDISQHEIQAKPLPDIRCALSSEALAGSVDAWRVYAQEVCSDNCYAEGEGVQRATLNEVAEFDLYTRNYDNKPCERPVQSQAVECELKSSVSVKGNTMLSDDVNHYRISYTPKFSGSHSLNVSVEGVSISGSPFKVAVRDVRHPIAAITNVEGPWGVAINHRGQTIVAENSGNCISIFDSERKKVDIAGKDRSCVPDHQLCEVPPNLDHPCEVAIDKQNNILVANRYQHNVAKFRPDGTFKSVGAEYKDLFYPTGIAVHPINDKIYVTDTFNHRIRVLNSDLTNDQVFGKHGDQKGAEFVYPTSVICDSTGKVFVVDNSNHRILVFTAEGNYISSFGQYGDGDGEFSQPIGIAVDNQDKLYISDRGNHRICIFTSEGCFVSSFHSPAGDDFDPSALAVDSSDHMLYVCCYKQGEVQLFHV